MPKFWKIIINKHKCTWGFGTMHSQTNIHVHVLDYIVFIYICKLSTSINTSSWVLNAIYLQVYLGLESSLFIKILELCQLFFCKHNCVSQSQVTTNILEFWNLCIYKQHLIFGSLTFLTHTWGVKAVHLKTLLSLGNSAYTNILGY